MKTQKTATTKLSAILIITTTLLLFGCQKTEQQPTNTNSSENTQNQTQNTINQGENQQNIKENTTVIKNLCVLLSPENLAIMLPKDKGNTDVKLTHEENDNKCTLTTDYNTDYTNKKIKVQVQYTKNAKDQLKEDQAAAKNKWYKSSNSTEETTNTESQENTDVEKVEKNAYFELLQEDLGYINKSGEYTVTDTDHGFFAYDKAEFIHNAFLIKFNFDGYQSNTTDLYQAVGLSKDLVRYIIYNLSENYESINPQTQQSTETENQDLKKSVDETDAKLNKKPIDDKFEPYRTVLKETFAKQINVDPTEIKEVNWGDNVLYKLPDQNGLVKKGVTIQVDNGEKAKTDFMVEMNKYTAKYKDQVNVNGDFLQKENHPEGKPIIQKLENSGDYAYLVTNRILLQKDKTFIIIDISIDEKAGSEKLNTTAQAIAEAVYAKM